MSEIDRVSVTGRPSARPIGFQTWTNLAFAHWKVPVEVLRPLVPERLTIDTFGGSAWLAVVPFQMSGVRPAWYPFQAGYFSFPETNVRTYVHLEGRDPGVWFLSLDAASRLAVWIARWNWNLNYFFASMSIQQTGRQIDYRSTRRVKHQNPNGEVDISVEVGSDIAPEGAAPGTLEHFLAERYLLYSADRYGHLYQGRVWHRPYPLKAARVLNCRQSLSHATGVPLETEPDHVLFSDGVQVEVFPLRLTT